MKTSNMKAIHLISALLSACSTILHVRAQSAPGFPIQVKATQNLRVDFQSSNLDVDPAGALLQREDLLDPPTVQGPKGSTATLTFMLFMVDQDVATDNSNGRQQLLHFFQPNLSGGSEVLFADQDADNFTSVPAASYIPPSPPAGDGPHRYTLLLYSQPQDFQVPNSFQDFFATKNSVRVGWDMAGFAEAAGLGEPVAANWFRVQNGDSTGTTGAVSSSSAASATATGGGGEGGVGTATTASTVSTSSAKLTFSIVSTSSAASSMGASSGTGDGGTPSLTIVTLSPTATPTSDAGSASSASATGATVATTDATSPSGAATGASTPGSNASGAATAAASSSSISVGTSAAPSLSVLRWSNLGLVATSLVLGLVTGADLVMW
ncbi:hypothetical protein ABEF92_008286 [Exophiala dermatitidis]|uniref:Phosphatidylethanolamine-binding protein n=1 Tax=Exophiala dermatitidis (strain ATCC 34100 / CBS 525.76 / NIH/UT8656) TaxID=858893 RepID=H6BS75_EXODN|nr:uncharacterized protein HMPREF1120_02306 [Exophiala dermatitidis NIH/UT8656]XP_009154592.1 hypothetical protein, variant [Exophiala dermatitidis NIH/UT8656]EHY54130.1 hypothetical protein, variant [Exophiala dermatitidis NIH/UT8656]EHY54131.1 hypothetical protein HMPREF1120_02306 [Exophiala dermatitidis NIH/UT8656]